MASLGDPLGRVARQVYGDLLREEEDAAGVLVSLDVERSTLASNASAFGAGPPAGRAVGLPQELEEVEAGEVAGGVVEEDELAAGIRCVDAVGGLAGVPLVDGVVELQARVRALPGGLRHLPPELARGEALHHFAGGPGSGLPDRVLHYGLDEPVGHPDRVVRVLARDGPVGVAAEVRRVAGRDQRRDLLLLARLPLDEL